MFNKMPNIFSGYSVVFVLSHTMFYVHLTLLVLVGSLVLGNPWYTRSFALILISETYVICIHYVTNPTRCHIGVQIWTTDVLHTLAYQVIPTSLDRGTQELEDLPLDYRVSRRDLYVEDILFDYHLPAIGQPNAEEVEAARPALPPYWCNQVLLDAVQRMEAARAHLPRGVVPNINVQPFGVQREPENPEGAIRDPLVDSAPSCGDQIQIPDTEVHATLSAALYPEICFGDPSYQQ